MSRPILTLSNIPDIQPLSIADVIRCIGFSIAIAIAIAIAFGSFPWRIDLVVMIYSAFFLLLLSRHNTRVQSSRTDSHSPSSLRSHWAPVALGDCPPSLSTNDFPFLVGW
jgi:hypothetical protein